MQNINKWMLCVMCVGVLSMSAMGSDDADLSVSDADFAEGRLNSQFYGQTYHDFNDGITYDMGTFALEYFFDQDFAVAAELSGWRVGQEFGTDTSAVGLQLMPRFYLMHEERLSVFYEIGAGIMYAHDRTPMPNGSHFNFTAATGFGMKWLIAEDFSFFGGGRYLHLSNMNRHGRDGNPSFDGAGGYLGFELNF